MGVYRYMGGCVDVVGDRSVGGWIGMCVCGCSLIRKSLKSPVNHMRHRSSHRVYFN